MSFDFAAFGWHATVFLNWQTAAALAVLVMAVAFFVKLALGKAG